MIRAKKLGFRAIGAKDLPLLADWLNDEHLSELVVGRAFPVSLEQQQRWFERSMGDERNQRWMVETFDGETIGLTGLWDIDYVNRNALTALKIGAKDIQGKGYGTDAILAIMAYAFGQLGLERLWGEILAYNVPSYKAYVEKCGWKVEGVLRKHVFRSGAYHDVLRVAILREEFMALPAAAGYIVQPPTAKIELDGRFTALPVVGHKR